MHTDAENYRTNNPVLCAWIKRAAARGFRFAASLDASIDEWGGLTDRQYEAAEKCRLEDAARDAARNSVPESDLDLTDLPSGYYAVPDGDTRLKVRVSRPGENSKWHGWVFVDDGAYYGERNKYGSQRPGAMYRGKIVEQLRAILDDPREASKRYGRLVGRCGVCGRHLEDETSVAEGIGPVCAGRLGW